MKTYLMLIIFCTPFFSYSQSCFEDKSDVSSYVLYSSFSSEDGKIRLEFSSSQATLRAGSSTYNYMYDRFSYLGSGYKGLITMSELSGGGGLRMYVSCREDMMTDNNGTILYKD